MRLEFLVEGSRGDHYKVTFARKGNVLNAFCTCPAGENGQHCKHRLALLGGCSSGLLSGNLQDIGQLKVLMNGTDLENAYRKMAAAMQVFDHAKTELDSAKKALTKAMYR